MVGKKKLVLRVADGASAAAGGVHGFEQQQRRRGQPAGAAGPCTYKFAVITHGDNGNFWSVVYKGAKDAAKDMGCKLTEVYGSQQQGQAEPDDNAENAQIQNAINAKVDGIAVSDHDPSVMNATLAQAPRPASRSCCSTRAATTRTSRRSKAITCVGQPESLAGQKAGQRFKQENATNVLCVIHQSGQNLLDRCNGIAQGLGIGQHVLHRLGALPADPRAPS